MWFFLHLTQVRTENGQPVYSEIAIAPDAIEAMIEIKEGEGTFIVLRDRTGPLYVTTSISDILAILRKREAEEISML